MVAKNIVLLCLATAAGASAHEIGTSRVSVLFHEGRTYDIELVTDAASLVEKLLASAGRTPRANLSATELQAIVTGFDQQFRSRVKVDFDGSDVYPTISYSVVPAIDASSAPAATIRLTGEIPERSHNFAWTFGWTFASYAMTVRSAVSQNPVTQWLEGSESSKPFALTSPEPRVDRIGTAWRYLRLGFTHIMPLGLDHMLFVLGIYLLTRRVRSILLQVSAFTIAHSITLALSMYGLISVSPRIVEPMIAVSIAYVAIENIFFVGSEVVAGGSGLHVRPASRNGFCGSVEGTGTASFGVCDGVVDV